MKTNNLTIFLLLALAFAASCRGPEVILPPEKEQISDTTGTSVDTIITIGGDTLRTEVVGFYLLNEGNMGSNKATLDYYDYRTAEYTRNIYSEANPSVAQSLGDVGNDLQIYGSQMFAVINCSNLIEVMDAATAKHKGTIEIPNCRYLAFADGYCYCTSYAGPVQIGNAQIGYVAKIDTATLRIVDTCHVGFQPDGLEVVGTHLYVANSGGYLAPDYDNRVSVIDLLSFETIGTLTVASNLFRAKTDRYGQVWINSRGDYYSLSSRLYCITLNSPAPQTGRGAGGGVECTIDSIDIPVSNFCIVGDSLYFCGTQFSYETYDNEITYGIVNVRTRQLVSTQLITDGTDIQTPYGIAVHPVTREIYITDAGNYVYPGTLYCFSPDGICQWSVRTGDIPSAIAFLTITYN